MEAEFGPNNKVVRLCLQGMASEDQGLKGEAVALFSQAWDEAVQGFERFYAAYFLARAQGAAPDKLKWFQTALQIALATDDDALKGALPSLYTSLAQCHEDLKNTDSAEENHALAASFKDSPSDRGPFFHGTKADLKIGDLLTAGGNSNYALGLKMNHIYFTALANGAGLAAALAKGDKKERVYRVEPSGKFEDDPNVTNKKFPGNPTRSYRSEAPLKVVAEVLEWVRPAPEVLEKMRERAVSDQGKIIN